MERHVSPKFADFPDARQMGWRKEQNKPTVAEHPTTTGCVVLCCLLAGCLLAGYQVAGCQMK